jgi:hypothetical protein
MINYLSMPHDEAYPDFHGNTRKGITRKYRAGRSSVRYCICFPGKSSGTDPVPAAAAVSEF